LVFRDAHSGLGEKGDHIPVPPVAEQDKISLTQAPHGTQCDSGPVRSTVRDEIGQDRKAMRGGKVGVPGAVEADISRFPAVGIINRVDRSAFPLTRENASNRVLVALRVCRSGWCKLLGYTWWRWPERNSGQCA